MCLNTIRVIFQVCSAVPPRGPGQDAEWVGRRLPRPGVSRGLIQGGLYLQLAPRILCLPHVLLTEFICSSACQFLNSCVFSSVLHSETEFAESTWHPALSPRATCAGIYRRSSLIGDSVCALSPVRWYLFVAPKSVLGALCSHLQTCAEGQTILSLPMCLFPAEMCFSSDS